MIDYQGIFNTGVEISLLYVPKIVAAIFTLLIGLWIIKLIVKVTGKAMIKKEVDASLQGFLRSLVGMMLKILLLITVISMMGVQMTSFIAILGAAGLAVGLALQGSLANFAGGVLLLLFKPYKVGDVIEAQGFIGGVHEIQIFNTILKTADKKTVIIPNGPLSNGSITNYSTEPQRRVDFTFGIGYNDDIDKATDVLDSVIKADSRILADPAPMVKVLELADSSVNFGVKVWCKTEDYWDIYFDMSGSVKKAFDAAGISIPFPQTDVHLYKHE